MPVCRAHPVFTGHFSSRFRPSCTAVSSRGAPLPLHLRRSTWTSPSADVDYEMNGYVADRAHRSGRRSTYSYAWRYPSSFLHLCPGGTRSPRRVSSSRRESSLASDGTGAVVPYCNICRIRRDVLLSRDRSSRLLPERMRRAVETMGDARCPDPSVVRSECSSGARASDAVGVRCSLCSALGTGH